MNTNKVKNPGFLIFICAVAALGGLLFGYDTVVIGGTQSSVTEQFRLSADSQGFFTSSALIGCILGVALAGWMSNGIGRKKSLIVAAAFLFVSAIGCGQASGFTMLIIARALGGVGVGLASCVAPLYIAELSPPHLRGALVSLFQLTICIGLTLALFVNQRISKFTEASADSFAEGSFSHQFFITENWRAMFSAEAIPALIFLILCFLIPLSPRWLFSKKRKDEALLVLTKVRGDQEQAQAECREIEHHLKTEQSGSFSELVSKKWRLPLFIGCFLAVFSDFSGISIFLYYSETIFLKAGLSKNFASNAIIWVGLTLTVFTFISMLLVDKLGRRKLMWIGNTGCIASLLSAGIAISAKEINGPFLVLALCSFMAFFSISLGPIKWVVISEIFPLRLRGLATSVATMSLWMAVAFNSQVFPRVQDWLLNDMKMPGGPFYLFALLLVPQAIFIWKVMPETKGKSLEEIEDSWSS